MAILVGLLGTYAWRTLDQFKVVKNNTQAFLELLTDRKYGELEEYLDMSKLKMADIEKYGVVAAKRYGSKGYVRPHLAFTWDEDNQINVVGWRYQLSRRNRDLWLFTLKKEGSDWKIINIQPMIALAK
jgi:hypothetical protein